MKDEHKEQLPQDKDRHLDIPQEANQDKHINFRDMEDDNAGDDGNRRKDQETEERQRQWREGIEEGKIARNSD
jgi:hypothetical protein